ncbi:MAG TPA: hypothetical protein V6C97_28155 [Oculatellaceae cyanobacterium]
MKTAKTLAPIALLMLVATISTSTVLADDIYESALPPPLRTQAPTNPILKPTANSGNPFMLEEKLGENPQVYYASPSKQSGYPSDGMIDNSPKIRPLPDQWVPYRPSDDNIINFNNNRGASFGRNRGFSVNSSFNSGFNTPPVPPKNNNPYSPDYDNSMRKPDRFVDNPVTDSDGVRHFSNGKHFDLSQMSIDQAITTVNTPDPNVMPPKRRQNQNQPALNNSGLANNPNLDNFQQQQQQQQQFRQRRRRRSNSYMFDNF